GRRLAPIFQAEGQEEKESRQEGRQKEIAAQGQGTEEAGEKEKGSQEETPPLAPFAITPAGASRRDAPAGHVKEKKTCVVRGTWFPSRCCLDAPPQRFR